MIKTEIIEKIPKLTVPTITRSDIRLITALVTVVAATHLVNKVEKVIREIDRLEHPDDVLRFLR